MTRGRRYLGLMGVALRQLRGNPARTAFAICGVAVAVLAVTLLVGVGAGVTDTGERLIDESEQDLWISGGAVDFQPGTVGGVQNQVPDAHSLASDLETREEVAAAVPLGLQAVHVSPDGESFDTTLGAGVTGDGGLVSYESGEGFEGSDTHWANGSYDGPMTHEVVVDPAVADRYDLAVGDSLHVGATISDAQRNEFEVVGISRTFREFTGTDTVAIRLSELQTLSGATHDDRASTVLVRLEDGADVSATQKDLEATYPDLEIRTNEEQLTAVLERQALVIAAGVSLVGLAVLAGLLLSFNLFLSLVYQQRREFAMFRAMGGSRVSTLVIAITQGLVLAAGGCLLGVALSPVLAMGIEWIAVSLTGFEGLVAIPTRGYLLGVGVAGVFGLVGTVGGVWRLARTSPLTE